MSLHYARLRFGEKTHFTCLRCGQCCTRGPNVGLTAYDVHRIARYLGVDWRELKGKYVVAVIADMVAVPTLRGTIDGKCVFLEYLDGTPSCRIYPARPMRCRLYPFMPYSPGNTETIYLDTCCPGLNTEKEAEPPWKCLKEYYVEAKRHYAKLYHLVFQEGCEPLEALEKTIEDCAGEAQQTPTVKTFKTRQL
ncbi:MAG: YkgJ family cysteine cluster protein [Candidatus Bathyarchaeia archaeon]|nr:YkgJ family cysteine cluster protein [Candidatus Bathyarchaeota archaeon]